VHKFARFVAHQSWRCEFEKSNMLAVFLMSACGSTAKLKSNSDITNIMNIIALREEKFLDGLKGTFLISVKASGIQRNVIYLNTKTDYRHRRNITVALYPKLTGALTKNTISLQNITFSIKPLTSLVKRNVLKLTFSKGKMMGKYSFLTHIRGISLNKIKVAS
jgi:hypothetical protein